MEQLSAALLTEEESEAMGGVPGWRGMADPFFGGACAEQYFEPPDYLRIHDTDDSDGTTDSEAESSGDTDGSGQ